MFKTKDLDLAATIEATEISVIRDIVVSNKEKKELTFMFDPSPDLDILVKSYWDKSLSVEPRRLLSTLRELKRRIHEIRKSI